MSKWARIAAVGFISLAGALPAHGWAAEGAQEGVKINTLLQAWALADSTSTTARNNYRIRRAEIKLSGNVGAVSKWFVMIDPAKSLSTGAVAATNDNKVLQDLGVVYGFSDKLEALLGQFKIPTTAEGLDSSGDLLFPERSLVGRTYGDKRQTGLQLRYKEEIWKVTGMLSNGGAANTDDATTPKDFHLRADVMPLKGLSFGGFVGAGDFSFSNNGRWGLNALWSGESETLRFELAQADTTTNGAKTSSSGYVVDVGYFILPELQPVFRFERLVPDTSNDSFNVSAATLGLNYLIQKNQAKIQASYGFLYNMSGSNGSAKALGSDSGVNGRLFILSYQVAI